MSEKISCNCSIDLVRVFGSVAGVVVLVCVIGYAFILDDHTQCPLPPERSHAQKIDVAPVRITDPGLFFLRIALSISNDRCIISETEGGFNFRALVLGCGSQEFDRFDYLKSTRRDLYGWHA